MFDTGPRSRGHVRVRHGECAEQTACRFRQRVIVRPPPTGYARRMASPDNPTDDLDAFADAIRAGDDAALTRLLQQYEPRLRTAARVLLGPWLRPHLDSLDLVQSVHRELLP